MSKGVDFHNLLVLHIHRGCMLINWNSPIYSFCNKTSVPNLLLAIINRPIDNDYGLLLGIYVHHRRKMYL